jgi:hypothetical protein
MKSNGAEDFEGMILWWGSLNGATVVPGSYKVNLNVNGETQEQTVRVVGDPRLNISDEDYDLQYKFIDSVNEKVTEAHTCIKDIRALKKQMKGFSETHKIDTVNKRNNRKLI